MMGSPTTTAAIAGHGVSKCTRGGESHEFDAVRGHSSNIPMGHPATAPNTVPHSVLSAAREAPNHRSVAAAHHRPASAHDRFANSWPCRPRPPMRRRGR